jgi:DNA-binding MarR family transcriptional regulator
MSSRDDLPIPALMHFARGSYGDASRLALAAAGYDDLPRNGGLVLAGLDSPERRFTSQADAVAGLRRSKQRSSQLVDTLVLRGYVERTADPDDRRRMTLRLTDRGRGAAAAIQEAVDAVDAELERRITVEEMQGLRAGLAALGEIRAGRAEGTD